MTERQRAAKLRGRIGSLKGGRARAERLQHNTQPLSGLFERAVKMFPGITVSPQKMAGAPCIAGTRIPVYMVLDAIQAHASLEAAQKSYPNLSMAQIQEAIGFARFVVESPIDQQPSAAS